MGDLLLFCLTVLSRFLRQSSVYLQRKREGSPGLDMEVRRGTLGNSRRDVGGENLCKIHWFSSLRDCL